MSGWPYQPHVIAVAVPCARPTTAPVTGPTLEKGKRCRIASSGDVPQSRTLGLKGFENTSHQSPTNTYRFTEQNFSRINCGIQNTARMQHTTQADVELPGALAGKMPAETTQTTKVQINKLFRTNLRLALLADATTSPMTKTMSGAEIVANANTNIAISMSSNRATAKRIAAAAVVIRSCRILKRNIKDMTKNLDKDSCDGMRRQ